jgi:hypothetical protein
MESKGPSQSHCSGCGALLLERNRYYTGKFMTARDFQGEQDYLRSRSQLHNRLMHGWGIVCGLEVMEHPQIDCRNTTVIVKAGVAMDGCGREVVLVEDTVFEVPRKVVNGSAPVHPPAHDGLDSKAPREEWLLCLYYGEEQIELMPAIYSAGPQETDGEEANRVREVPSLKVVRLYEVEDGCWQGGGKTTTVRDDCADPIAAPAGAFLKPDCPCGTGVPLALLHFERDRSDDPVGIDSQGRRHFAITADQLTHIVKTNWRHGETMTLHHLREKLNGRLEIWFDRRLHPAPENLSTGVSEYTFIVQYGGVQEEIRYLPYNPEVPPFLEGDESRVAVFPIDHAYLDSGRRDDLKDKVIYVSLKCDFIVDCRNLPVDGSFLGGVLPTHSGRMGGTFESWFSIAEVGEGERSAESRAAGRKRSRQKRGDNQ